MSDTFTLWVGPRTMPALVRGGFATVLQATRFASSYYDEVLYIVEEGDGSYALVSRTDEPRAWVERDSLA